ncbi:uncharacterized protein LOC117170189 [Belonocnema kinseyi]|uniref:uncharacterized protein LOC117170189 n=1 Tax=Belonocnema kinseyi TaxID=2817044 RepID=UPI00143DF9B4|nr:uncharacterized protein LOC117170189 [Belonocnema kinseyi]
MEITEYILKIVVAPRDTTDKETIKEIPLNTKNTYTCGRSRENDITLPSTLVSKHHCLFFRSEANLYLQDLKTSRNGTFINGKKQKPQVMVLLKDGDIIGIGYNQKEPTDPQQYVYQLHKQVIIDLARECVKTEMCEDIEEEDHETPSKLLKISETSSKTVVKNLGNPILRPETAHSVFANSLQMSFEITVNKEYTGPMPNVFVNKIPLTHSANGFQMIKNPAFTENQSNQSGWIRNSFQASHTRANSNAIPQNEAVFQEMENVVELPGDNVTSSSTSFSINKQITVENSIFEVTEISPKRSSPPINATEEESSTSEKEVSTTQVSAEEPQEVVKPKDAVQPQLHRQSPDSTNAENEMNLFNFSANYTDSDTSNEFCTSMTKTSRSNTSEEKLNMEVAAVLKSSENRLFTVGQKTASVEISQVLRCMDQNTDSRDTKKNSEVKYRRTSSKKTRNNIRNDSKSKISKDPVIRTSRTKKIKLENEDQVAEESDTDESFKLYLSDEGEGKLDENANFNISSTAIDMLQRTNDLFIEDIAKESEQIKSPEGPLTRSVDPRTCKTKSQLEHHETNCSINIENNLAECNPSWETANTAISSLNNVPLTYNPYPFPNAQYPYLAYPNSYSNPQDFYSDHYPISYINDKLPYYQLQDHQISFQNYQTPYLNYPPPCPNNQIPYSVGQTPLPVPYPNIETPQSNNNQFPSPYSNDLSSINSLSAEKTSKEKAQLFEEFSASWHYKGVEETHRAERIDFKNKKATPRVISSERVNLPYKSSLKSQLKIHAPKFMPYVQKNPLLIECLPLASPKPQVPQEDKNLNSFVVPEPAMNQDLLDMHCVSNPPVILEPLPLASTNPQVPQKDKYLKTFDVPKPKIKLGPLHVSSSGSEFLKENKNLIKNSLLLQEPVQKIEPDMTKLGKLETYIPADKLFRSAAKSDEVLMNIVSWRPAEFESCFSREVPCVLNKEKIRKTQPVYNNHEDYCKVQIPLILIDISYKIKNAYKVTKERTTFTNCKIVKNSASIIWIEDTYSYMMGFNVKVCGSKLNSHKPLTVGDFLRVEITKGDTNFRTLMFAYVAKILDREENNSALESLTMTFGVVTKLIDFNLYRSKIKELSLIMSLLPSINLVMALESFKESPLLPMILNPDPDNYQLVDHLDPGLKVLLETSSTPDLLLEENLNYEQLSAVRKIADVAIRREPKVALIEGFPGTGKTKVIVDTIIEILNGQNYSQDKNHTMKILVSGVSNSEIDEILHRVYDKRKHLKKSKALKMVRVGLVDQMSSRAKDFSLQELAKKHIEVNLNDLRLKDSSTSLGQQLKQLYDQINAMKEEIENKNNKNAVLRRTLLTTYLDIKRSGRNINDIYPEEYANLLEVAEHTLLSGANVIVCTLDMCHSLRMDLSFREESPIPVLIVENATQALETDILKPLTFGVQTLVLVGDVCKQSTKYLALPILESHGFDKSLYSRLRLKLAESVDCPLFQLNIQYRMNKKISYFPNKFFYMGKVTNAVAYRQPFPLRSYRIFNVETLHNFRDNEVQFMASVIQCIIVHAKLKNSAKPLKIGIITASKSSSVRIRTAIEDQMELILEAKRNLVSIEVDTIHKFKNQERDVICALCHRPKDGQRFVDSQRLYSIMTLAKHSLILYGEFRKFEDETSSLWNSLIQDGKERKVFFDIEARPHLASLKMLLIRF